MTLSDLTHVCVELSEVQDKWQQLALELEVSPKNVNRISKPSYAVCFKEIIKQWLTESPEPTWQNLMDALRSPTVREYELASRVEKKCSNPKGILEFQVNHTVTVNLSMYN